MTLDLAIRTSHLSKHYHATAAVEDLSLHVRRGEIYGFLGLNGAGKTTTIRMLLGMIRPSGGAVEIFGMPVQAGAQSVWSHVGYLVETPHAYPELTVRENLDIARRLRSVADWKSVERSIDIFGLAPYAETPAAALSLGNAQRLGLAKALLHGPELVLLDEPANALDPAGVVEVRELLRKLALERGVTVFMSSHILAEAARLATRIGIIHRGRLIEELSAQELEQQLERRLVVDACDRDTARQVLAGAGIPVRIRHDGVLETSDPGAVEHPERISELLVRRGVPPSRLCVQQADLETHFLNLVGAAPAGGA